MFFFFKTSILPSVFHTFPQEHLHSRIIFLNFYEVFLNMGLSGCQNSNFCGEDLMFIFQNLNFTISFSYFFSPGPPWDPRGDPACDKISSICKIWQVFIVFHVLFSAPGCFFHVLFRPGMFFSCCFSPRGVFFMFLSPREVFHHFYSNHIVKSYYKIIL